MALTESKVSGLTKESAFRIFKIILFWVLMINVFYYVYEDVIAYLYLAPESTLFDKLEAFASSIDCVTWMVLIILFEMETSAQSKGRLTGMRKWLITGFTAVCYLVLVYAAYGYAADLANTYRFEPVESKSACYFANADFAYIAADGRPVGLTDENCGELEGEKLFRSPGDNEVATASVLPVLVTLGWIDVFNSNAWLFVVLLFQIEFSLEQAKMLTKRRLIMVKAWKGFAYLVLLVCAILWTIYSAFIDYWDAWLWLLAFILIDLDMLGLEESANQAVGIEAVAG